MLWTSKGIKNNQALLKPQQPLRERRPRHWQPKHIGHTNHKNSGLGKHISENSPKKTFFFFFGGGGAPLMWKFECWRIKVSAELPWRDPPAEWCLSLCPPGSETGQGTRHIQTGYQSLPLRHNMEVQKKYFNMFGFEKRLKMCLKKDTFPSWSSVWYFCSNLLRSSELTVSSNTVSISNQIAMSADI